MNKPAKIVRYILIIIIAVVCLLCLETACSPAQQTVSTPPSPVKPTTTKPTPTPPTAAQPFIVSFAANPANITVGGCSTLRWSVTGTTTISISSGMTSGKQEGSTSVCPSATTTYTLTATNANGSVTQTATVTVMAAPTAPIVNSFTASPSSVYTGICSNLSWNVAGATSVTVSPEIGSVPGTSSTQVCPSATKTYTLTATNNVGSVTRTATVTIMAAPAAPAINSFTASPASVYPGICSSLSWNVSGATSVIVSAGIGSVPGTSSSQVCPASTTTYTLTATNTNGSITRTATVTIIAAPAAPIINSFTVNPSSITTGTSSVLSWSVSNATTVTIDNGVGNVSSSGSHAINPATTTTYTILASNGANTITKTVTITVIPSAPTLPDTTVPTITEVHVINISSSAMGGSAEITWKTNEPATGQVSYGTSAGYGTLQPSPADTTLALFHDVILYGLAPQTTFHYKLISRDADGNEKSSPDATFATPASAGSAVGDSAPDFTLASADGSQVTLSALHGKKVIINFWNLDCHYCMEEMPYFQAVRDKYPDSSVAMLIINSAAGGFNSNRAEAVGAQITSGGYTFTVPLDEAGSVAQAYDVTSGIPMTFFVDSTGIIKSKQDGAFPSSAAIESRLNSY